MCEKRLGIRSPVSRFHWALAVGMTSFVAILADGSHADAAWLPFPRSRKAAEDAAPKSNSGFNASIRRLLTDAKAQEEQGNLDKAIALADRAARMSESTSAFVKPAPDVSPTATARYARDLRLKKVEQSEKRKTPSNSGEKVVQKDRSESKPKSNDRKVNPPSPKNVVATAGQDSGGTKTKDPAMAAANAVIERQKSKSAAPKASEEFPTSSNGSFEIAVVKPAAPVAKRDKPDLSATKTDPTWDEVDSTIAHNTPKATAVPRSVAEKDATEDWFADPAPATSVRNAAVAADEEFGSANRDVAPAVLKLRREYSSNILEEVLGIVQTAGSKSFVDDLPDDSAAQSPFQDGDLRGQSIIPVAAEQDATSDWDASTASDEESPAKIDQDESFKTRFDAACATSANEVESLRVQLLSAALLEPGAVAHEVIMASSVGESPSESARETYAPTPAPIRLRKRRQSNRELPKQQASAAPASHVRQTVVGQASVVQWRPANESMPMLTTEMKKSQERRTDRRTEDLRTSLRDVSMTAFETSINSSKSNTFAVRTTDFHAGQNRQAKSDGTGTSTRNRASVMRESRGSAWDNAMAPPGEIGGAVNFNSMGWDESASSPSSLAPLPPPEAGIERTSFVPNEWGHTGSSGGEQSIAKPSDSSGRDEFLRALDQSISAVDASSITEKPATRPMKGNSKTPGILQSFLWTILSAAGVAALVCGAWIIRAAIRSGH